MGIEALPSPILNITTTTTTTLQEMWDGCYGDDRCVPYLLHRFYDSANSGQLGRLSRSIYDSRDSRPPRARDCRGPVRHGRARVRTCDSGDVSHRQPVCDVMLLRPSLQSVVLYLTYCKLAPLASGIMCKNIASAVKYNLTHLH